MSIFFINIFAFLPPRAFLNLLVCFAGTSACHLLRIKTIPLRAFKMATLRITNRSLLHIRKEIVQCLWTPCRGAQAVQSRSISYITHTQPSSWTSRVSTPRRSSEKHREISFLSKSSLSRRNFSTTRLAAHGDWSPPKAGEEYVKIPAISNMVLIWKQTLRHIYR